MVLSVCPGWALLFGEEDPQVGPGENTPAESAETATVEPEAAAPVAGDDEEEDFGEGPVSVYVVPIEGPIDSPQLYILRRALKDAIEKGVDVIVLKMNTPGGALNITLEMMQALERFPGLTITFVDREAISAGSFIAMATDDIYFVPSGVMGAAAVITGTGEDVGETLKQKIDSYLRARVRVLSEKYRYRADVQRAMMDSDFELELDGKVIVGKGELLTLTAKEAATCYGEPPEPLLARGIADNLDQLLNDRFGEGNWEVTEFKLSWSEEFAKWLRAIAPVLMGIGLLLLFIEFKTPGFGVIGIAGIVLILVVFTSNYVAGLAGYEAVILLVLGLILIGLELFLLPGTLIAGLLGLACVIGALAWSLADIWPGKVVPFSLEVFMGPLAEVLIGILIAIVLAVALTTIFPQSWFFKKLTLGKSVGKGIHEAHPEDGASAAYIGGVAAPSPSVGARGIAATDLFPSGRVEVDGVQFHAKTEMGVLSRGEAVEVVAVRESTLIVRKI